MGACHSDDSNKRKTNDNKPKNEIIEEIKEKKNESTQLKSVNNKFNHIQSEYNIRLIDISNNEYKYTIKGEQILSKILKDIINYNPKYDFVIEFENFKRIESDKKDQIFSDIIKEVFDYNIPEIINMKYTLKGLDIPENAIKVYMENNKIIGSAIMDTPEIFGIITYETDTKKLSSYKYQTSEYPIINTFNNFTAFCNAKKCLYLSGGENEQSNDLDKTTVKYNDFLYIDLSLLTEDKLNINELPSLIEPRTWHSMIFVPNKYIFIVGGSNTKSVELYDIEENKLTKDSELNEIRCECTLCLVNDMYLYAFFGFVLHQEYNNSIERCNLLKDKRKWEYVDYQVKEELNLKLSFFGIIYLKENELLLIGENDNNDNEKRYDYNYTIGNEDGKDTIKEYDSGLEENNVVFREKLFHPIDDNIAINIPTIIGENIKVFIFESGKINIIDNQEHD